MMNNPFVLDRAAALAQRVADQAGDGVEPRINLLYRLLYTRPPRAPEIAIGQNIIEQAGNGQRAWQLYAHVLLCGNEFIYID